MKKQILGVFVILISIGVLVFIPFAVKNIQKNTLQSEYKDVRESVSQGKLDEAKKYMDDGTFKKAASLFGKVSNICNEIDNNPLPSNTFLENLGN